MLPKQVKARLDRMAHQTRRTLSGYTELALLAEFECQRDFAAGTPIYDSNGNEIGRRVHNSLTGDTNNLGNTGRMLSPWEQY